MKKSIFGFLAALSVFSCGEPAPEELGQLEEEQSGFNFSGLRDNDGWEHRRCNMNVASQVCYFPAPRSGANKWLRNIKFDMDTLTPPAPNLYDSASGFAIAYIDALLDKWSMAYVTSVASADLHLAIEENLFAGTPPNTNILLSSVVHVGCAGSTELIESLPASGYACKRFVASVDVGSINAWMNQWATTTAQKRNAWMSIYLHIYGISIGLGATDSTDTAMRRMLIKNQSPISYSNFEICTSNSINFEDPSFANPNLAIYSNTCN